MLRMIADLRGGVPARCDFCGAELSEENEPVPEEGDMWCGLTCCWERWEREEKKA
jgi:hypothetical protein